MSPILSVTIRRNINVPTYPFTTYFKGFETIEGHEGKCEELAKKAGDLLSAQPVRAGRYTVILDPELTGTLVHEAFGHLSEADFIFSARADALFT